MITTITSKGQITLPAKIRRKLNLHAGNRVEFLFDNEQGVRLIPIKSSVKELKGFGPKPAKPLSIEKMQESIEEEAAKS